MPRFRKTPWSKKFIEKRVRGWGSEGSINVSRRKIFSSGFRKYLSRNPLEFRSTRVSKKFMNDVVVEGERKCHFFTSNMFCLTIPKSFMKDPSKLWFRKLEGSKKFGKKGGMMEYQDFSTKIFFSQFRKFW